MQRKHTNDGAFTPSIASRPSQAGPMACPQPDCNNGKIDVLIYGGYSGDYTQSYTCKACDGRGHILEGLYPYQQYISISGDTSTKTGYPNPIDVPREIKIPTKKTIPTENQKDGCFIATEVYGNYNHPQVLKLRKFRDSRLKNSFTGRKLIFIYYNISPKIIPFFKIKLIKKLSKKILDNICLKLR